MAASPVWARRTRQTASLSGETIGEIAGCWRRLHRAAPNAQPLLLPSSGGPQASRSRGRTRQDPVIVVVPANRVKRLRQNQTGPKTKPFTAHLPNDRKVQVFNGL